MAILKAAGLHSESAFAHSLMNGMPPAVLSSLFFQHSHNPCMFTFSVPSIGCCKLALVWRFNGSRGCGSQRPIVRGRWPSTVLHASADGSSKKLNGNGAALVEVTEGNIMEISGGNMQTAEQGSSIVARRLSVPLSGEIYDNKDDYVLEENINREADDGSLNDTNAIDEELSKANIHPKSMDIILASRAYEHAQKHLVQVSKTLDELSNSHTCKEKRPDLHADSQFSLQENIHEIKKLKLQMASLEEELDYKNETLQLVLKEAKCADEQLRTVLKEITLAEEKAYLQFETSESSEFTPLEQLLSKYMTQGDIQLELQETLANAENKASTLHSKVHHLHNQLVGWKMSLDLLEEEGKLSSQALQIAAQELNYARIFIVKLTSKVHQQVQELEMNKAETQAIEEELESTRKDLEVRLQLLSNAETEASSQKKLLLSLQEALKDEKEASTAALRSTAMQEKALQTAEKNISELLSEVANLKELLEEKEHHLTTMHEEAKRSANAMIIAAKNEDALVIADKKIKQLVAQVSAMQEEIRSRNLLLSEIKEDAVQTTEALKFATQIKQELESKTELVNELRQEITENERATLAEQALRYAEKEMNELNAEVEVLRKGVHARDEALKLMKDEIDRNIGVLSYAAENRESLQKMQLRIKELEADLRRRDALLKYKEKEQELGTKNSSPHIGSSDTDVQPPSAVLSSVSVEMPKARKRSQRSTQTSRKITPSQDSFS
ncbi:hypothetical protein O6H91_20G024800 [Diphasiastrum complanatum]|uniref:Uncharacterized protein n=1 Tax=Diphasiastrum complanatum TaxID=34168 RepID=A0ACC2ANS3_DIPCM|nr:hypothetical protein O6H91_20G024800 [Diphasiastrum complanatum]